MNTTLAAAQATIGVADLILARYALPNAAPKKVREDVGKLLTVELSGVEFDKLRAELACDGLLSRGSRNAFTLTEAGRRRALEILELHDLPPRMNWGAVIKRLFPKATGLSVEAAAKLDTADKLAAYILKQKYGLADVAGSSVNQVLEAITCKQLGFPVETTLVGLLQAVLSKLLGWNERLTKSQLAKQLPLFETGLSKISADEARYRFVRNWLTGSKANPIREEPPAVEPFDLAAFASTVRRLASVSPSEDRFYDNKVFIAPLWRTCQREQHFPRMSLPEFKQRLIEANMRHLLHLSRADLVQAMDPRLVADSEAAHLHATFHFVLLEEDRS